LDKKRKGKMEAIDVESSKSSKSIQADLTPQVKNSKEIKSYNPYKPYKISFNVLAFIKCVNLFILYLELKNSIKIDLNFSANQ
jgi:hypothetical protein